MDRVNSRPLVLAGGRGRSGRTENRVNIYILSILLTVVTVTGREQTETVAGSIGEGCSVAEDRCVTVTAGSGRQGDWGQLRLLFANTRPYTIDRTIPQPHIYITLLLLLVG